MTGDELKSIALKHRTVIAGYEFADKFDFDAIAAELAESDARVAAAYQVAAAVVKAYEWELIHNFEQAKNADLQSRILSATSADADRQIQIVVTRARMAQLKRCREWHAVDIEPHPNVLHIPAHCYECKKYQAELDELEVTIDARKVAKA